MVIAFEGLMLLRSRIVAPESDAKRS